MRASRMRLPNANEGRLTISNFTKELSQLPKSARYTTRRYVLASMLAAFAAMALPSRSAAQVITPAPGSAQRSEILNALRPSVQAQIGGTVEFVVSQLRVLQDWAFVSARPQRPGGQPIDWRATKFRRDWEQDMMSDLVLGLLRRNGTSWRVLEYAIGPTDVVWENWVKSHGVPRSLFIDQ
jgi:hypothetical protein